MRRLSQTWKQKRTSDRNQHVFKQRITNVHELKNEKDSQSNSKVTQQVVNVPSPSASFNLSFGFEFDAADFSEVDKIVEQHLHCEPVPQSPLKSSDDVFKGNVTPKLGEKVFTPPFAANSKSRSVTNKFGRIRERISTPIEDSENVVLFSSAHSPVFSPVTGAFQQFENSAVESQAGQRSLENPSHYPSKCHVSSGLSGSHSRSVLDPDVSSSGNPLELSSWGLPPEVLRKYNELGITHMFEWQAECLRTGKVLAGGNLVYSAPTSAGKTMVAELLMLKRVLETKRKALFILPFISVVREKMFYLQRLYQEAGVRVEGYMGSHAPPGGFVSVDIAVCTIEKANSLLNRLLEENKALSSLAIVVVDEMHMIGDPHRGYLLELFLTKIRYIAGCKGQNGRAVNEANEETSPGIQIVGMSATLPNLDMLAKWLSADLYFTDHRPVPLTEMVKVGSTLYDANMEKIREISAGTVKGDEDHVIPLCKETIVDGHSVLVFCPTKNWCEKLAETIAKHFAEIGNLALQEGNNNNVEGGGFVKASSLVTFDYASLREVIEQLKRTQVGLDSMLSRMVPHGVAFHHAGLTFDERDIIEGAFRQGSIRVLVATSTLSSGVNLPARRVIIRTPMFHGKLVDALIYKQMAGRAGRKGVDALGESVLMCKPAERQKAASLLNSRLKAVQSCLLGKEDNGGIKRALLEVIASGVVTRPQDVERYAACTFFASVPAQQDANDTDAVIKKTVKFLVENEFVRLQRREDENKENNEETEEGKADDQRYVPTQLGLATLSSALSPDEALVVFAEVQKARKCFVLESELHIIYQVTPIYIQDQWPSIDWYQYLRIFERLPANMRRVADLVGIEEGFLARAVRGRVLTRTEQQRQSLAAHRRFYVALALQDLVHEVPLNVVARRYGANRGMLQSLQGSSATFAGMVTVFCEKLGWTNMEMLLSQFQSRLSFGVERELCDLVRISLLNAARARMLYNAGYHTIASVAAAPPSEIENILHNAAPFVSGRKRGQETEIEVRERNEARVIWVAGRRGLTEGAAAKLIVGEAKKLLQADVAQLGIQWKPPDIGDNTGGQSSPDELKSSSEIEGSPKSFRRQPAESLQSVVTGKTASKPGVIGKPITKSKSPAIVGRQAMESGTTSHGAHQEIVRPHSLGKMESIGKGGDFLNPPSRHLDTRVDRQNGQVKDGKAENIACVLKNRVCLSTSEAARSSSSKHPKTTMAVSNTSASITPMRSGITDFPRSRSKRRSPIPEMPEPQEKLKKKETAGINIPGVKVLEVNIPEESKLEVNIQEIILPKESKESKNSSTGMEVSGDSKLCNESQSVSMELYSEPFEGEEAALKEKTNDVTHGESNAVLDSQALAACSLSDTCLMECDVIVEEKVVTKTNESSGNKCENMPDKMNTANTVHPGMATLQSQEIIGEYDTQPPPPATGKFHTNDSFDIVSSFASPVLQSPKGSAADDVASTSAANSFSLRLSSSDGCLDSDLSMLAVVELMEKEADAEGLQKETESKALPGAPVVHNNECDFTIIKNLESTNLPSHKDEKSPAKKISRCALTHNDEIKENEMPDSDIVPSTPPRGKQPSQDEFKTKPSATPLSTRKRSSPRRSPYSSSPDEGLVIIDVAGHEQVFAMFLKEWRSQTRFSLAVACERFLDDVPRIGGRFSNAPTSKGTSRGLKVEGEDLIVVGVAVSWSGKDAYYVSLKEHTQSLPSQPDDSQAESAVDSNLTLARRVNALKSVVQSLAERGRLMVCFDVKEHFKTLARSTGISLNGPAEDPKVANWLLDPGAKEKNLHQLVGQHLPEEAPLLEGSGGGLGTGGLALAYHCQQSGRVRACVESVLVLSLMKKLGPLLEGEELMSAFTKVEMPSVLCLARMELNGLGFSDAESEHLKNILQAKLRTLEEEAYRLANHSFSLTSREDVAQVLFVELKLPHDGNSEDGQATKRKTLGVTRRGTSRGTKHLSTNKEVLERLKPLHPLPGLIIEWRRINSALTKVVFPLQKEKCFNPRLDMPRIHSMSQTHTTTGRVSFAEPNLQNVPKDFDITLPTTIAESPPPGAWDEKSSSKRGRRRRQSMMNVKPGTNSTGVAPNFSVSMRNAFVPFKNGVLLAADYSQLELRLIAHLANDERLRKILNGGGDVFRMIAGELYRAPAESIKDNQRQHAKQVCYGIIYGIGAKALGEQLGLAEEEAALFIDKFTSRFVGVKKYLKETVEQCKKQGFVKTVTGRKRFLPSINSPNTHAHSQAARQAVNTTVQGSAADLVKTAMVNIDKRLTKEFPSCVMTHRHSHPDLQSSRSKIRGRPSKCNVPPPVGGFFVLQLHDELIFEVSVNELRSVAQIVKTEMEDAMKLSVVTPVKMKAGPSWGNMAEFEL